MIKGAKMTEYFSFLHLKFDVTKAKKLAKKYKPEKKAPILDWVFPLTYVDPSYVPSEKDLLKATIFATLPQDHVLCTYLIDGNHRVSHAIRQSIPFVNVVTLNIADSLKILKSSKAIRNSIEADARKMGLIT